MEIAIGKTETQREYCPGGYYLYDNLPLRQGTTVCVKKMEKKIVFLGNYYGKNQGLIGSTYHAGGVCPTIVAAYCRGGKGLVLRKWKRKEENETDSERTQK